jgi:DNA-binding response OmpR family regulator
MVEALNQKQVSSDKYQEEAHNIKRAVLVLIQDSHSKIKIVEYLAKNPRLVFSRKQIIVEKYVEGVLIERINILQVTVTDFLKKIRADIRILNILKTTTETAKAALDETAKTMQSEGITFDGNIIEEYRNLISSIITEANSFITEHSQ